MADDPCNYAAISTQLDKCAWVQANQCEGESIINFYNLIYCHFHFVWEGYTLIAILAALFLIFLFYAMGLIAQKWLTNALAKMSKIFKMSESLAGVTLVALGNGAPDVVGGLAASNSASSDGINLSIGALVGSSLVLTHFISPLVTLIAPNSTMKMPSRTYMRDLIFLVITIDILSLFFFLKTFAWWVGMIFLLVYIAYVVISVMMDRTNPNSDVNFEEEIKRKRKQAKRKELEEEIKRMNSRDSLESPKKSDLEEPLKPNRQTSRQIVRMVSLISKEMKSSKHIFAAIINDDEELEKASLPFKLFYYGIKVPLVVVFQLTFPPIEEKEWDRRVALIFPLGAATFLWLVFQLYQWSWYYVLGIYGLAIILTALIYLLTRKNPGAFPVWGVIFPFVNFLISVVWMWFLANIIVDIIEIVGNISDISIPFLGVTFMAIGNSVGDMMTDISLAKIGFPQMGMTATVSGSVFNVMLGMGMSLVIQGVKGNIAPPTPFVGSGMMSAIVIMAGVAMISVMVSYMVISKYTYTRGYALIQIMEYVGVLILMVVIQII